MDAALGTADLFRLRGWLGLEVQAGIGKRKIDLVFEPKILIDSGIVP